ncbi:hypothetical protein M406DRAFT_248920 [Cryphonectria parasitica EP155]|uniref:DUF5672 domain-containing protein n=1 Tax=Cryphonectria parasitica (strain ATCC 38755 / EP155) TaxID=660469 RepID=A0A9P4YES4_CRYP1|nr:uncharacterized protein M406DRAFT_248920 [Cryphonectria parasitica EP155]KAF3771105.1 hypothetical protein M406DRAFT_248920 [Cryphonectria parasitica EP155]
MLHFANVLGPAWPVVLVTLRANWIEPPSPAFRRLMAEQRIRIFFLPDDTTFPDHPSVSKFFTRPWLWERFASADRVLLFQADSVLCSRSERRVSDFLEWDLVGAPISSAYGVGYNGGLSLRNPKALLDITRDPANAKIPSWEKFEDQWFYMKLKTRGEGGEPGTEARLPSVEVASQFAVETVWAEEPLGYHQPFRWLTPAQKTKVMEWCPEVAMLQDASHFFS